MADGSHNLIADSDAAKILRNHNVLMINNSIQLSVDHKFNRYELPIFCINEPISYESATIENKNLKMEYSDKISQLTVRCSKFPNENIKISEHSSTMIELIKATIVALKSMPHETKMRLFYNGREMKDDCTLGNYNYVDGAIVQAMII